MVKRSHKKKRITELLILALTRSFATLFTAELTTAAAEGTVLGLAGLALIIFGIWRKAFLEERWLSEQLEPESYGAYRQRLPMLIPFGPKR